jgi:hypothetical protein
MKACYWVLQYRDSSSSLCHVLGLYQKQAWAIKCAEKAKGHVVVAYMQPWGETVYERAAS